MQMKHLVTLMIIAAVLIPAVSAVSYNEFIGDPLISDVAKSQVGNMNIPDYNNIDSVIGSLFSKSAPREQKVATKPKPRFDIKGGKITVLSDFEHKKYEITDRKTGESIEYYPDGPGNTFTKSDGKPFDNVNIDDNGKKYVIIVGVDEIAPKETPNQTYTKEYVISRHGRNTR